MVIICLLAAVGMAGGGYWLVKRHFDKKKELEFELLSEHEGQKKKKKKFHN